MAALAALIGLTSCSYSSSEAVTDLAADLKTRSYVSDIRITDIPAETPSGLAVNLGVELQKGLASCATGPHPLRLDVSVTRFNAGSAAMAMLIGSTSSIEGSARLVQPDTGALAGDYLIHTSTTASGVIGAVAVEHSQHDMARAFASDVCRKAFGRDADYDHPPASAPPLATILYPQPPDQPAQLPVLTPSGSPAPWHETPSQ